MEVVAACEVDRADPDVDWRASDETEIIGNVAVFLDGETF